MTDKGQPSREEVEKMLAPGAIFEISVANVSALIAALRARDTRIAELEGELASLGGAINKELRAENERMRRAIGTMADWADAQGADKNLTKQIREQIKTAEARRTGEGL